MAGEEQIVYALAHAAQKKALRRRRKRKPRSPAETSGSLAANLSPTQETGRQAEEQAKNHLVAAGLIVLQQNLRCKTGEIDLICLDQAVLAFIEVRHRSSGRYGGAAASVNLSKRQRLIRTANFFLPRLSRQYFQGRIPACRFDVVTVEPQGLVWLKGAFALT